MHKYLSKNHSRITFRHIIGTQRIYTIASAQKVGGPDIMPLRQGRGDNRTQDEC